MATKALSECIEIMDVELRSQSDYYTPVNALKKAVLTLKEYEDKRGFLDIYAQYQVNVIKWGIFEDKLSNYSIQRLRQGAKIKDIAEEIARVNLSQIAQKLEMSCKECSQDWLDFLINC